MQVWTGHATGISHQSNHLTTLYRIADGYQRLAQMKVRGDDSASVIDVDDIAGEKKVVDERNHSTIGCTDRLADRTAEIDAEVTSRELAVEQPARPELTGDHRTSGFEK